MVYSDFDLAFRFEDRHKLHELIYQFGTNYVFESPSGSLRTGLSYACQHASPEYVIYLLRTYPSIDVNLDKAFARLCERHKYFDIIDAAREFLKRPDFIAPLELRYFSTSINELIIAYGKVQVTHEYYQNLCKKWNVPTKAAQIYALTVFMEDKIIDYF